MKWTDRYRSAHHDWQKIKHPAGFEASGGYSQKMNFPCVTKANGLTLAICNFLNWQGHRATRISSAGRYVAPRSTPMEMILKGRFIPGTTRRGTADISATIRGRAVMLEVKAGADKPSEYQIKEQAKERAAGGVYEFVHTMQEFLSWYDCFTASLK